MSMPIVALTIEPVFLELNKKAKGLPIVVQEIVASSATIAKMRHMLRQRIMVESAIFENALAIAIVKIKALGLTH